MSRAYGFLSAEWSQVLAVFAHRTGRAGPGEEVRFPICRSISCSVPLSLSLVRVASCWCSQVVNVERGGFQGWAPARLLTAIVMWNMLAARCGPSVPAWTPCSTWLTGTGGPGLLIVLIPLLCSEPPELVLGSGLLAGRKHLALGVMVCWRRDPDTRWGAYGHQLDGSGSLAGLQRAQPQSTEAGVGRV